MKEDFVFADRAFSIHCNDRKGKKVCTDFFSVLWAFEDKIKKIMDLCDIPSHVIVNFEEGNETLDGFYHVQSKRVLKHLIVIDIFTKQLRNLSPKQRDIELMNSFIHELLHHKYKSETQTEKMAKKNAVKLFTR